MSPSISSLWLWSCGAVLLILFNATLVATELAILRVCLSHFEPELAERLRAIPRTRRLVDHAENTVRLLRASSLLCVITYALVLFVCIPTFLREVGSNWGGFWHMLLVVAVFFAAYGVFVLFGVLVPRIIGLRSPETVMRMCSRVLPLFSPLKFLLLPMRGILLVMMRVLRVKDLPGLESLGFEEQIEHPGEGVPALPVMARKIFRNALDMRGLEVSDVLLPRNQVQWMDLNDSVDDNLKLARTTGHTRFPLCDGDLDRCIGLIHIKDIFRKTKSGQKPDLRRLKRDMLRISPDQSVEDALQLMLGKRQHMALVVDEFRGTEGLLTLEKLLELLVGEIRDEFDAEEENIVSMPNGDYSVSGLTPVYELEREMDMEFENQEVSTFGGLITAELGKIPDAGERLAVDGLEIVVTEVDDRRVIRARVHRPQVEENADEE